MFAIKFSIEKWIKKFWTAVFFLPAINATVFRIIILTVLIYIYRSLEATLNELRQYKRQHDEWAALLNKILAEQASLESRIESRMGYEEFRMRQSKTGKGKDI